MVKNMSDCLKLKKSNCRNCYKCIRNCTVKSIAFSDNQANIIPEDCILCGNCFIVCPQNAKEIRDDVGLAEKLIASGPTIASIAPSFAANYGSISFSALEKALKSLGFAGAEETALGAELVAEQYDRLTAAATGNVIISTCCHTVNLLVEKYYPDLISCLAPVVSPMQAHCRDIKRRNPGVHTVFIGPCISKKDEAEQCRGDVDCVLTFEELSEWMRRKGIVPGADKDSESPYRSRLFPIAGGILRTMSPPPCGYTYITIDGIESCIQTFKDIRSGGISDKCFIEMSACRGSCINGPVMDKNHHAPVSDYLAITRFAGEGKSGQSRDPDANFDKQFHSLAPRRPILTDSAIEEVLREIGKTKPEHELNCGSCGYNTCREKARAVIEGKANLTMCLPYLKEKAESFSDTIVSSSPNAIIVVNELYRVELVNKTACRLLRLHSESEILGEDVTRVLSITPFAEAFLQGKNTVGKKLYLAEYGIYVEQTVIYDPKYHIIICTMRDVTNETTQYEMRQELSRKTIEITDRVIEKQMRAVQEIASLLGETTAETKVALTKLKESLKND